jgi:hypothetical protein
MYKERQRKREWHPGHEKGESKQYTPVVVNLAHGLSMNFRGVFRDLQML